MDNVMIFAGNLTADPTLKYTPTGRVVTNFSIASNRRWSDQSGATREYVTYIDCQVWGALAENVAEFLKKGQRITVNGIMDQESWQTDSGDKRSRLRLTCQDVGASMMWGTTTFTKVDRSGTAPERDAGSTVVSESSSNEGEERVAVAVGDGGAEPF